MPMRARRVAAVGVAGIVLSAALCARAGAQTGEPVLGPARDVARARIVSPAVFDPLLTLPLAPEPQAVVDVHGGDVSGTFHAALRNGDDSYGILVSTPLSRNDASSAFIDPRGLRDHPSLGFDLTNVIWRPRTTNSGSVSAPWALFLHASYQFNRGQYEYVDPATRAPRSETRLNDTASALGGVQFLARDDDPGYFVGFSFTYSAVFHDAAAVDGVAVGGPSKVRGNLLRLEMRRQLPSRRAGINPSYTYDVSSRETTVDVATYLLFTPSRAHESTRLSAGVRVGHRTGADGGAFVTVFAGPVFGSRP
jgi:hypothetical protein